MRLKRVCSLTFMWLNYRPKIMTILSPTLSTWYWQERGTTRVISTDCHPLNPLRWDEINLEKFQELVILRKPVVEETKEDK
jgi:hypothetical protein